MKIFCVSLFLLFGFMVYVPQAVGETIYPVSKARQKEVNEEELSCISQKKATLTKDYTGPNLKLIDVPQKHIYDTMVSVTINENGEKIFTPIEQGSALCTPTGNTYYIDVQSKQLRDLYNPQINYNIYNSAKTKEKLADIVATGSKVCGCKEYVEVFKIIHGQYSGYEVTDVPADSYLKYIPETQEMQVLPNTEKSRKQIVKSQEKQIKLSNKKLKEVAKLMEQWKLGGLGMSSRKEKLKNLIAIVISVLSLILIVLFIIREILKKFKK